jgi:hypothetical protein
MKLRIPKIKDAQVTKMTVTPTGAIKYMTLESFADEINLSGVMLDNNAEITIYRIHRWPDAREEAL